MAHLGHCTVPMTISPLPAASCGATPTAMALQKPSAPRCTMTVNGSKVNRPFQEHSRRSALVLSTALLLLLTGLENCNSSHSQKKELPDIALTPGDVLDVSKDDVCATGYTRKVRNVPASVKNRVYSHYKMARQQKVCCEVDHLVPLELGGSNREANLWPQLYTGEWNAHVKNQLEARLHHLVCSGEVDLKTAQHDIAADWIVAYQRYVGPVPAKSHRN